MKIPIEDVITRELDGFIPPEELPRIVELLKLYVVIEALDAPSTIRDDDAQSTTAPASSC